MNTEQMIFDKYGPLLGTTQLQDIFKHRYGTAKQVANAISDETFPIETSKDGARRVAHYTAVAKYLDSLRPKQHDGENRTAA